MYTWKEFQEHQPVVSKLLINSVLKQRIFHAYLIQGLRGSGKRKLAILLAKTILCIQKKGIEPCQNCNICLRIESGNHPDVHWIEPDGRTIKTEQIQKLQEEFMYTGFESDQKIYILSQAETLTLNAANRILKFLEEPNQKTVAILLTENVQAIIPTIRSRCQFIDLKPLNPSQIQDQFIQNNLSKEKAVFLSAITNDLEEALSLAEDEWFAEAKEIVLELVETYMKHPPDVFLMIHNKWIPHFKERNQMNQGLHLLLIAYRDLLYYHIGNQHAMVMFSSEDERIKQSLSTLSVNQLIHILNRILEAQRKLRSNVHPTLVMEQLALQI